MQPKIKYRLIGLAVILISAAIVFPVFFDGEGYKERHLKSAIPEGPDRPEIVRIEPVNKPLPDTSEPAEPKQPVELPKPQGEVKKAIEKTIAKNKIEADIHKDQPVLD